MPTIHIAKGDYTSGIQKRKLGKLNIGFYCSGCGEFVAFAVTEPQNAGQIAFGCDGAIEFSCPFCHGRQKRLVTEIEEIVLTEGKRRWKQSPAME